MSDFPPPTVSASTPATEAPAPAKRASGCVTAIIVVVVLVGGFFAYAVLKESGKSESHKAEDRSLLACRNFREVAADYDVLTPTELRSRLLDVREDAQGVATADVEAAATEMVQAANAGADDARLAAAVKDMDAACKATGN